MKKILFLFLVINAFAFSQLNINVQNVELIFNVATVNFPEFQINVRANYEGQLVVLDESNIVIREDFRSTRPFSVAQPDANGFQEVKWHGAGSEYFFDYQSILYVTYNSSTSSTILRGEIENPSYFSIRNDDLEVISEISYPIFPPNQTWREQIRIDGGVRTKGLVERRLLLSSIELNNPVYEYEWLGSDTDNNPNPPPINMIPASRYWINIAYTPTDYTFQRDVLKFNINENLRAYLPLYGGTFRLEPKSSINVIYPNGGERFSPCEEVLIRWEGHNNSQPVEISYSVNDGVNWEPIATVVGSEYLWSVPPIKSNSMRIRVLQRFESEENYPLYEENSPVQKIDFSFDSQRLITANEYGSIYHWNLAVSGRPEVIRSFNIYFDGNDILPFDVFGLNYINDEYDYVVGHKATSQNPNLFDSLICYDDFDNRKWSIKLPEGFNAADMQIDAQKEKLFIRPVIGNEILVYELSNIENEPISLRLNSPVNQIYLNQTINTMAATCMDGNIHIYDSQSLSPIKTLFFEELNIPDRIGLSPDGNLLLVSTYNRNDGSKKDNYLIELNEEKIIGVYKPSNTSTVGLEFNPISNAFVVGASVNPQLNLFDLTNEEDSEILYNHFGRITGFKMSPDGQAIASIATSNDRVRFQRFAISEADISDESFAIDNPEISYNEVNLPDSYIGYDLEQNLTDLCIVSDLSMYVDSVSLAFGEHWQLNDNLADSFYEFSDCIPISMNFNPQTVGAIYDTLLIESCGKKYKVVLNSTGLARNISFFDNDYNFGEVCTYEIQSSGEYALLRNDDPVPLIINNIEFRNYPDVFSHNIEAFPDTVAPGEILYLELNFRPADIFEYNEELIVYHSVGQFFSEVFNVLGEGIGIFSERSHEVLYFIPEIQNRILTVTNIGDQPLNITSLNTNPADVFTASANLPMTLGKDETIEISVSWIGNQQIPGELLIESNPCLLESRIELDFYQATTELTFGDVEADPRERASIPIFVSTTENGEYKGQRFLETEFDILERIFMPDEVISDFGTGSITKNTVQNGIRTVGVRVEGDFPTEGTIAEIIGYAGLAEVFETNIIFNQSSIFFGENVNVTPRNGKFSLIEVCDTRTVMSISPDFNIVSIGPNPTSDMVEMTFEAKTESDIQLTITDPLGNILQNKTVIAQLGINSVLLDLNNYSSGSYTVTLRNKKQMQSKLINVIR